jgi:hypothetical protein
VIWTVDFMGDGHFTMMMMIGRKDVDRHRERSIKIITDLNP